MAFNSEQIDQILRAQQAVVAVLKQRFNNLTVEETGKLAGEIVKAVLIEVAR